MPVETPPGECPQCWHHGHASREAHAGLGPREDCPQRLDHMTKGCPSVTPKKSIW